MGPVTKAIDECLEKMSKNIFTIKELYALHDGDVIYKAFQNRVYVLCKTNTINKVGRTLFRKPIKEKPKVKTTKTSFSVEEIGQGIIDYATKLEKENLHLVQKNKDLVKKYDIENSNIYQRLEQQLQELHIKFREKQQELINKIDVIRKLKKQPHISLVNHKRILKEQTVKSKKCIKELVDKIKSFKEIPENEIPKNLFTRITKFIL